MNTSVMQYHERRQKQSITIFQKQDFSDLWNPEPLGAVFDLEVEESETAEAREKDADGDEAAGMRGDAASIPGATTGVQVCLCVSVK